MIKVLTKKGALKTFYYLMALDEVNSSELECFRDIGFEMYGEEFSDIEEEVLKDCNETINAIEVDEERYDVIQEALDKALNEVVYEIEDGVVPRMLIWNMLTLAYSDKDYSVEENRLISHAARMLQIEKSVLAEMKQLINVFHSVQAEKELIENSPRPYLEVKPLLDEVEKRQETIIEAAKNLIADDLILESDIEEENKAKRENAVLNVGKKIGETVASGTKKVGDTVAPIAKNAGGKAAKGIKDSTLYIGEKASQGTGMLKEGAGKLFSKIKGSTKKSE